MRVPLLVLLFAVTAAAQSPAVPEVRGTVVEIGTNTPIPGAKVTVYEFAPNADNFVVNKTVVSTVTDANGGFSLKPGHLGNFSVASEKPGYAIASRDGVVFENAARSLTLSAAEPVQTLRMTLTRPATITGRVIDGNGNPVPNLRVVLERAPVRFPNPVAAVTNGEGIFTASTLSPGAYVVHIEPAPASDSEDLFEYSEAAFNLTDEDVEPSYWPGGVADPDQALPITVAGGAIANAGTIAVRKTTYYRVRLTLAGECAPNERWSFRLQPTVVRYTACRKDALLTRVPPGAYTLTAWTGRKVDRWAETSFVVTDKNTQAALIFNSSVSVSGRVTAAEGADRSKLGDVQILLRPSNGLPAGDSYMEPSPTGEFTFEHIPGKTQWLSVEPSDATTYVKEIRYDRLRLRSHELDAIPGAAIDIVLDSGAATLAVTLKRGETVSAGRAILIPTYVTDPPRMLTAFPPFSFQNASPMATTIMVNHLPPGDYRILVLPLQLDEDYTDAAAIAQRFTQAPRITLTRGEQKSIELQLK